MRALLLIPALALAACGGSDADADSGGTAPGVVQTDIDPCQALTPAMISQALGVAESDVTLDQEGMDTMEQYGMDTEGVCSYTVADSGDYDGVMLTVKGYANADAAETLFDGSYQTKTEEQLAEIETAADQAAEQVIADGRGDALEGVDAGAMISGLAGKFSYEPVDGLGDQAVVEINAILDPPVTGLAVVRDGNVLYNVVVEPSYAFMTDPANGDAIRDAHVAVARQIID